MTALWRRIQWLFGARLRRLLRALAGIAAPDDAWAARLLSPAEWQVYSLMDPRDREHACRVTKRLLELHPNASPTLVQAALLHDCGKALRPYNPWERWFVSLYTPTNLELPQWWPSGLAEAIAGRIRPTLFASKQFHPQFGAGLIRYYGGAEAVAALVGAHHDPQGNIEAQVLCDVDDWD
jgi:hypothetical protein